MSSTNYVRSQAEQEFVDWLDTVCTPVDTSKPMLDPERDYAQEKHDKREAHRHRYLMKHSFWYRQDVMYHREQEQLQLEAELKGEQYVEPRPLEHSDSGFWEQFTS